MNPNDHGKITDAAAGQSVIRADGPFVRTDDDGGSHPVVRFIVPNPRGYSEDVSAQEYQNNLLFCAARLESAAEEMAQCCALLDQMAHATVSVAGEVRSTAGAAGERRDPRG